MSEHNSNAYEVFRDGYKNVIWQPYLFFHIYDHFSIPHMADMFGFWKYPLKFYVIFTNISHLTATFILSHL